MLHHRDPLLVHVSLRCVILSPYPESIEELFVVDLSVLVHVEAVEDGAEFLRGKVHADLLDEIFKLELVQRSRAVDVEFLPRQQKHSTWK